MGQRKNLVKLMAVMLTALAAAARGGIILDSQDRYTRESGQQIRNSDGSIVSQHDDYTYANAFNPFNDVDGSARQTSAISTSSFTATANVSGSQVIQTSTSTWTGGESKYQVVFDVVDHPEGFHITNSGPSFGGTRSLSGPGGPVPIPFNGSSDVTLGIGTWTLIMRASVSGQGAGPGSFNDAFNFSMTSIPEPASLALLGIPATMLIPRRRSNL